jgi:hypothetical protein
MDTRYDEATTLKYPDMDQSYAFSRYLEVSILH